MAASPAWTREELAREEWAKRAGPPRRGRGVLRNLEDAVARASLSGIRRSQSTASAARLWAMGARRFRPAARVAVFLAAQGRCAACGEPLRRGWHADHVEPVSAGGAT